MEETTFEAALAQLEEAVRRLEQGDLTVDETVALFEQGTRLVQLCNARLDSAELRVSRLAPTTDGDYSRVPFEAN